MSDDSAAAPTFHELEDADGLREALERSHAAPIALFKHSTACPISARARREMTRLTGDGDPPVYEVVVQRARALSSDVAATFDIRHESPQVIVLYRGAPVFDASHGRVTADAVRRAAREAVQAEAA